MPSLYVHVPFCRSKCAYCAFYSIPIGNSTCDLTLQYLDGVAKEIKIRSLEAPEGVFSLFLGGGTPTVLDAQELDQLLAMIHASYRFYPDNGNRAIENNQEKDTIVKGDRSAEKTSEANPGTLTREKLEVLCRYGINRISLGVQSFNDSLLRSIGRIHNSEDIRNSIELIRQVGIKNLNLDLIFGLPGQSLADWQDTLKEAVACSPEHLSIYALTLEEDTPLGKKYLISRDDDLIPLPDDDLQADMYDWSINYLGENGYNHYEISNFARPGFECRHNLGYWKGRDYVGLGPGAVSCLSGVRTKNKEDIVAYYEMIKSGQKGFDLEETEILTYEQRISEYIMLGLRMTEGIDLKSFRNQFGQDIQDIYREILANYIARGVLILSNGRLKIEPRYFFVANAILQKFV